MLTLRPYQAQAVDALMAHPAGGPRGALLIASVGAGKTEMGLSAAVRVLERGGRVVWGAHRFELLQQAHNRLMKNWAKHGLSAGMVQGARDAVDARMVFASVATLTRPKRLAALLKHGQPDLLVIDEVHHATAATYRPILDAFRNVKRIGLTATIDREDGTSLEPEWDVVFSYDLVDAVRDGWLVEPYVHRYHMPKEVEREVNLGRLDLPDADEGEALLRHVVKHTVEALTAGPVKGDRLPWRDERRTFDLRQRSGIVFCSTIAQARATAEALCKAGWVARSISGDPSHTDLETRAALLREYSQGRVQVLCNADLLTEGFDAPRTGFVVYARATRSRPLFVQVFGRTMRLFDPAWTGGSHLMNRLHPDYRGRVDGLAIDLVGCSEEHSIIAAPVLVGDACRHAWERLPLGGAKCPACEATRPCWESLQLGRDGQHTFPPPLTEAAKASGKPIPKPVCRWCEREQCGASPEGRHVWEPRPEHKRGCMYCEAEYTDPLASLVKGRAPGAIVDERFVENDPIGVGEVALVRLDVAVETWAVDLDAHGLLFLAGDRMGDGSWSVRWLRGDGPRDVGAGYDTRRAWAVAVDLIRQTAKRRPDARGGERFGGTDDVEGLRARATEALHRMGVARVAAA